MLDGSILHSWIAQRYPQHEAKNMDGVRDVKSGVCVYFPSGAVGESGWLRREASNGGQMAPSRRSNCFQMAPGLPPGSSQLASGWPPDDPYMMPRTGHDLS
jgi:hypothetical protein